MSAGYEPVIGLEIHVQLATRTKMFCGCEVSFGEPPNTRTCPICLGLPGALPVANARAVHFGLMIGLALSSELARRSIFHRKNYFYPDLPKGYQISQYDEPLCRGGGLGAVRIHRVHLEEDAAKLIHVGASGRIHGSDASIVDFNRGGTPLVEIVTEPDIRSAEQAGEWLRLLRVTLRQLGVSDVNMEEGSLARRRERLGSRGRRRAGWASRRSSRTSTPSASSNRACAPRSRARKTCSREVGRSSRRRSTSTRPPARSHPCDRRRRRTTTATSPSLTCFRSRSPRRCSRLRARQMPDELPAARAERLNASSASQRERAHALAHRRELGDFFDRAWTLASESADDAQESRADAREPDRGRAPAAHRRRRDPVHVEGDAGGDRVALGMLRAKQISAGAARQVLDGSSREGGDPRELVEREGLQAMDGGDELAALVAAALAANPDAAARVREGEQKAIGPIVGHVMRESKGRADGREVMRLVHEQLGRLSAALGPWPAGSGGTQRASE